MKPLNIKELCYDNRRRTWVACDERPRGEIVVNPPPPPPPLVPCCLPLLCCLNCSDQRRFVNAIRQAMVIGFHPLASWNPQDGVAPSGVQLNEWVNLLTAVDIIAEANVCFEDINTNTSGDVPAPGVGVIQSLLFHPQNRNCNFFTISWEYRIGGTFGYELANVRICIDPNVGSLNELIKCRGCTANNLCRCLACTTASTMMNSFYLTYLNTLVNVYQQSVITLIQQMFIASLGEVGVSGVVRTDVGNQLYFDFTPLCMYIDLVPIQQVTYTAFDSTEYYMEQFVVYIQADQRCPRGSARIENINGGSYYVLLMSFIQESVAPFNYIFVDFSISGPNFFSAGSGSFSEGFCDF